MMIAQPELPSIALNVLGAHLAGEKKSNRITYSGEFACSCPIHWRNSVVQPLRLRQTKCVNNLGTGSWVVVTSSGPIIIRQLLLTANLRQISWFPDIIVIGRNRISNSLLHHVLNDNQSASYPGMRL